MEDCELCGRQTSNVYIVNIENVEMRVCASCAKGKKVVRTESESAQKEPKRGFQRQKHVSEEDKQLIEDYAEAIRKAREGMKLPIKVLAEMINEKEHLLLRVEEHKTTPSIALTKKLEKALHVKLTEDTPEETGGFAAKKTHGITIGDYFESDK